MRCEGPFRFELCGAPKMRFCGQVFGGMVQIVIDDAGDGTTLNSVPFWCDADISERLERAVAAFNREMLRELEPVKEAAE